jgi:hypothetical protein
MNPRLFDPKQGQAFQGDVSIIPMPADIKISTVEEIQPVDGRLILQEGEVSGHHHAIRLDPVQLRNFRPNNRTIGDPVLDARSPVLRKAFGGGRKIKTFTARMYRDSRAVRAMRTKGIITREDLVIGCLVVEGGPAIVSHEEHDAISLPPGNYLIGRQVESAGAEERVVAD